MSDNERIPVGFWLHDKKVNGILVKQHGEEKLTLYKNRYYIVTKETPAKKHYTASTLPTFWRRLIAGEVPPEPNAAQSPPPRGRRRKPEDAIELEQGTSLAKIGEQPTVPATPPEKKEPRVKTPRRQAAATKEKKESAAAPPVAQPQTVDYLCPYCKAKHSCQTPVKSPFFEKCSGCGKEFGVKIVPKVLYVAEVAAFK
jgi:hypothetical protein